MVDFKQHIEKGLSAHKKASAAKQEINTILDELVNQVAEATSGTVGISLKRDNLASLAESIATAARLKGISPEPFLLNTQFSLVAFDKTGATEKSEKLASWNQANTGYPCTLRFDNVKHEAHDYRSLISILGKLLASPETGRIISATMDAASKALTMRDENSDDSLTTLTPAPPEPD